MKMFTAVVLTLALTCVPAAASEVHCAAYTQQCGYVDAPATTPQVAPSVPKKCVKPKYRKHHLRKCGLR